MRGRGLIRDWRDALKLTAVLVIGGAGFIFYYLYALVRNKIKGLRK